MAAKRFLKQNLTSGALGLVVTGMVVLLAACGSSTSSDAVSFEATWDDVNVADSSPTAPLELDTRRVHSLELTMSNDSSQAVTVGHVRLQGSLLGLGFIDYDSTIRSIIEPGATETVTVPIDAFAVDNQARGYLQGRITLYGPSREVLGAVSVPLDGRGGMTANTMVFSLLLVLLAAASVTWNAAARARAVDPPDELTLAFHFTHSGLLIAVALAALASTLRVWPVSPLLGALLAAGAGVIAFAVGYLTARQSVEFEHGTYRGAPAASAARLPVPMQAGSPLGAVPAHVPAPTSGHREPLFPVGADGFTGQPAPSSDLEDLAFGSSAETGRDRRLLDAEPIRGDDAPPFRVVLEQDQLDAEPDLPLGISIEDASPGAATAGDVNSSAMAEQDREDVEGDRADEIDAAHLADHDHDHDHDHEPGDDDADHDDGANSSVDDASTDEDSESSDRDDEAAATSDDDHHDDDHHDDDASSDDDPGDHRERHSDEVAADAEARGERGRPRSGDRGSGRRSEPAATADGRLALDDDALPPVLLLDEFDEADLAALEAESDSTPGNSRRSNQSGRRRSDRSTQNTDPSGSRDIFDTPRSSRRRDDGDDGDEPKDLGIWGS